MKDAQQRLDKAADTLFRLMTAAEKGAQEACTAGHYDAAAKLHRMAAHMRLAYAEGRTLQIPSGDGGVIQPAGGGKG
jgi:hypothetical protein